MKIPSRNWGGARKGAGRKAVRTDPYRIISIVLSEGTLKRLDKIVYAQTGEQSRSKMIEAIISDWLENREDTS